MRILSESRCFGGVQGVYAHASRAAGCEMTFGLFLPAQAKHEPVPLLWFLAGLTCTHENAMVKAGAQRWAAEHGIGVCFPDTSPRGSDVADDTAFDLGQGASFYLNATQEPWAPHFRMWEYLADDLPRILTANFAIDAERQSLTGHSMGGHGALTLAMRFPGRYRSVSAFAPIAQPSQSDWGRKQFTAYLGENEQDWLAYDSAHLMQKNGFEGEVLIDQGTADPFLGKLRPEALAQAMASRRQPGAFRMQPGYDHSYFFVASFIADHISFHAEALHG